MDIAIDEIIEEPADVANAPTIDGTLRHWNLLKIQLFIVSPMKKETYLAVHLTIGHFL